MQKRITEAHWLLIITFGIYMGIQWLWNKLPFENRVLHLVIGQMALGLPGVIWIRWHYGADAFRKRFHLNPVSGINLKLSFCMVLCVYPLISIINMVSLFFVKNAMSGLMSNMTSFGLLPMLFLMAVLPSVVEEFLCRGVLYEAYAPVSKIGGAVLSGLIFGLLHLNFNQMPYALFIGIIFALMVEATDSLYTSMFMHFIINGINVVLNFLVSRLGASAEESEVSLSPGTYELVLMGIVFAIFLFMTVCLIRKTFRVNGRRLRRFRSHEAAESDNKISVQKNCGDDSRRTSIIDIWVISFIIFTIYLTYLNTNFR